MIDKLLVQGKHNHKYGADHPQYIFPPHDHDQQLLTKCSPSASSTPASPQYPPLKDDTSYGIGPLSSMVMSTTPHSDVSSGVLLTPKEEFMPLRGECHSRSSVHSSQSHDYSPRSHDFSPRSHDYSQDTQYNPQVDKPIVQKGCGAYSLASYHTRDDHIPYKQGLSVEERKRHLVAQREVLMMEQHRLRTMLMEQEALLRSKQDQLQRQQNLQRQRLSFFQQIGYLPPTSLPSVPDEYPPEGHSTPQGGGHEHGYNTPCPDPQSLYSMATTLPSYCTAGSSHHLANGLSPSQTMAGSPSSHSGLHASGMHPSSQVHPLQAGVSSHSMPDSPSVHNHHNGVASSHSPNTGHPSHTVTTLHPPLHNSLYMNNNNVAYNESMASSIHHMGYMTPSNTRHHPYSMASQPHRQYYSHGMEGAQLGGNYMMQQHMLGGGEHVYGGQPLFPSVSHGDYQTHTVNSSLTSHTDLDTVPYHSQHIGQQLPLHRKPQSKGLDPPELCSSAMSPLQSTTSTLNPRLSDAQTSFSNHIDNTTTTTTTSATADTQHSEAFNSTQRSDTETGYRCKQENRLTDAGGGGDSGGQIRGTNYSRSEMPLSAAQDHTDAYLLDIVGEVENEHNSDSGYHGYMSLQTPGMGGYHGSAAEYGGTMQETMSPHHMNEMEESRVLDQVFFVK